MINESTPLGLEERKARNRTRGMLADMLAEILLESDMSEDAKLGVRIVQQGRKVIKAAHEIVEAFAGDEATAEASGDETLKQMLEYLGLVEVGLKQFMETTKAPNANNAPNEI